MTIFLLLIAIVLPPVAVLAQTGTGGAFWLNLLLTLCFFVPGVVHAMWVVVRERDGRNGEESERRKGE